MITEKLAHFVAETGVSDIPQDALKVAQMGITDCIGVTFPGSLELLGKIMRDYAKKMGGVAESSIIGSDIKTSPYLAALVNGTMGHALDYDDMGGFGHPSVALAPAVLAIGESIGTSGKDVLAAYVIGFEVAVCLCGPLMESHYTRGWHSTDNFGTLGAAAALTWLLKLNVHQVRMALGIAASLAGGLRQNFGTMTKPLHAGQAAANGIQAALLAQAGFTADENIIETPLGFTRVFGHGEEVDWAKASEGLGKTFNITSPTFSGIAIKPYPACGGTHGGIDAAIFLNKEYGLKSDDIAEVELGTSPFLPQVLIHHRPKTGLEGKFSLEYTVARALHSGEVKLKHLTDEGVNEPPVKSLIERMKWVEKYPMPALGQQREGLGTTSVAVKLRDGKEYSHEVSISKGLPQKPLTSDEFTSKYRDCASTVLSKDGVEKSLGMLSNLAGVKNVRGLMETVTKS
ncbi:MAG: MmgE/PrpD family protein [Desulfobacteria bacterium]